MTDPSVERRSIALTLVRIADGLDKQNSILERMARSLSGLHECRKL